MSQILLESVLTCPHCGHSSRETMPTDACQFFHQCPQCAQVLKPKPGDCCVYCSYGDVPCPPIQAARSSGKASCCSPSTGDQGQSCNMTDKQDLAGSWRTLFALWGLPGIAMLAASWLPETPRAVIWVAMLICMGLACIINARGCGRTHCRYTGPFFLIMAALVAANACGLLPLGAHGWLLLGGTTILGSAGLWWYSERRLGRFS